MLQFHSRSVQISGSEGGDDDTALEDLIPHYVAIDFNPSTYWFKSSPMLFLLIFF